MAALKALWLSPQESAKLGMRFKADGKKRDGLDLLSHEDGGWRAVEAVLPGLATLPEAVRETVAAEALYRVHTERQMRDAAASAATDALRLPDALIARPIQGLSNELWEKLTRRRPATLGEARRISGMTAAGLALIAVHARRAA